MNLELDHLFVCVESNAPEAIALSNFGLTEGKRGIHRGQGTANTCFFFDNAYLELLWDCDATEIQSSLVKPLHLWERCHWRETSACPFGISFRLVNTINNISDCLPFQTWNYCPSYLPEDACIPIANNSKFQDEPLIFLSPSSRSPSTIMSDRRPSLEHHSGFKNITKIDVTLPKENPFSLEINTLRLLGSINFNKGKSYYLQIEFDRGTNEQVHDFAPDLPISFRW